mmetsp:Transcript_64470/g.163395  ORF Transcript_64470/g.163395 Transcript_64470/m.163395 type:complete len:226 (-) Transcript_64470:1061-1738(-)
MPAPECFTASTVNLYTLLKCSANTQCITVQESLPRSCRDRCISHAASKQIVSMTSHHFVITNISLIMPRRRSFLLGRKEPLCHFSSAVIDLSTGSNLVVLLSRGAGYFGPQAGKAGATRLHCLRASSISTIKAARFLSSFSCFLCNFLCIFACCLLSFVSRCRHCAPRMCAWSSVTQSTISSGTLEGKSASTPWHLFSTRYRCARRFCSSFRLWSCSRLKVASRC